MATRKTARKSPAKGRKTTAKPAAWRPAWYRRIEARNRKMKQVVNFWCGFITRISIYAAGAAVGIYVIVSAYF